jgi:hypothetical protein
VRGTVCFYSRGGWGVTVIEGWRAILRQARPGHFENWLRPIPAVCLRPRGMRWMVNSNQPAKTVVRKPKTRSSGQKRPPVTLDEEKGRKGERVKRRGHGRASKPGSGSNKKHQRCDAPSRPLCLLVGRPGRKLTASPTIRAPFASVSESPCGVSELLVARPPP